MPENFNPRPDSSAEKLIHEVFGTLEREADPTIARQRLANQLRRGREDNSAAAVAARPLMRPVFKVAAFLCGLILMASFAGNIQIPGWDDGQQVTLLLPQSFEADDYNHWVALFANRADNLAADGGHSLVVDYYEDEGRCYLKLNILGVSYSEANEWVRGVMATIPDLDHTPYSIQQPLVPYSVTVRDMLAFQLGNTDGVERSVMRAWYAEGQRPSRNCYMFLVARPKDAPRPIFGESF
ncbi:hypothetical protein IT575_09995 [bacterium]|nr:hypothetical protein [bacterium]